MLVSHKDRTIAGSQSSEAQCAVMGVGKWVVDFFFPFLLFFSSLDVNLEVKTNV